VTSTGTGIDESTQGRELLGRRVALASLVAAVFSGFFVVLRVVMMFAAGSDNDGDLLHPSMVCHVLAVLVTASVWWACRRGDRPARFVYVIEAIGWSLYSIAIAGMGLSMPAAGRPDYIVLLAITFSMMARAAYVPSSPRRTALIGVLCAVPGIFTTYWVFGQVDIEAWKHVLPQYPDMTTAELRFGQVFLNVAWWIASIAISTFTSYVIYGLRKEMRDFRKLGQYTLERKLGEGGMGVVYQASHAMLRRPTAVKLLLPERAGERALARFEREVQLTALLRHPNCVTVHDFGHTPEGVFYYAMELLDGFTLGRIVELDGPMPPGRVIHVLDQVCGALAEAHERGLIHRDIKPANIMLLEQGGIPDFAKVLDFGLVKEVESAEAVGVTQANAILGTPHYMAPETIRDPEAIDGRADLYALGVVAYYLLTATELFESTNVVEVCAGHMHRAPEPPGQRLGRELPADLEALVLELLAKNADDRPASARQLRARLHDLADFGTWTEADAGAWWDAHREQVGADRTAHQEGSTGPATIVVDLAERAARG
jgi:serine/threonine-protein kinase